MMTLDQLEAIQAIVDKGSFRAAAEHLNKSQPALSASIKNLEDELGLLIFDRKEYRPKLTEVGSVFLSSARAVLEAAHHASRVGIELGKNNPETKLRVSVDPLVPLEAIEIIAQECSRPLVPVLLVLDKSILGGSYQDLISGEVDLALAPRPDSNDRNNDQLEKIDIEAVTLVGVVSRKLLQEKNKANAKFLTSHAQILVYDKNFDTLPDDLKPNIVHQGGGPKIFVPDHYTKLRLIEGGLGWGRISEAEFQKSKNLVRIQKELCEPLHLELCLLRPKHRAIGPIARRIWEVFS